MAVTGKSSTPANMRSATAVEIRMRPSAPLETGEAERLAKHTERENASRDQGAEQKDEYGSSRGAREA
jgi:hypothetical protein